MEQPRRYVGTVEAVPGEEASGRSRRSGRKALDKLAAEDRVEPMVRQVEAEQMLCRGQGTGVKDLE